MQEDNFRRFPNSSAEGEEIPARQEAGDGGKKLETGKDQGPLGDREETRGLLSEEELQQEIDVLEQENSEIKNRLLRLQADFDNFRRRARAEKEEMITMANFNLVQKLLSVVDNLERALFALQGGPDNIKEGLEMIRKNFLEILSGEGVRPIQSVGEPFDPHFHEAVLSEENSTYPPGTVVEELQKGYIMHERVLRASKVKVSAE